MKILNLRKSIYISLSISFDYPSKEIFEVSLNNPLLVCLAHLKNNFGHFHLSKFYDIFFNLFKNIRNSDLVEIREHYHRFFMSPSAVCPPYASYWIDGYIMGPTLFKIINKYRKDGFVKSSCYKNLEDFISVEMEYLSKIIHKEKVFFDFLTNHTLKWIFPFLKSLLSTEIFNFYKLLSDFTIQFLNEESLKWWERC